MPKLRKSRVNIRLARLNPTQQQRIEIARSWLSEVPIDDFISNVYEVVYRAYAVRGWYDDSSVAWIHKGVNGTRTDRFYVDMDAIPIVQGLLNIYPNGSPYAFYYHALYSTHIEPQVNRAALQIGIHNPPPLALMVYRPRKEVYDVDGNEIPLMATESVHEFRAKNPK